MIEEVMGLCESAQIDVDAIGRALVYVGERFGVALMLVAPAEPA